jgi:death on curing protein
MGRKWASLHTDADLAEQAALIAVRVAQAHAFIDNDKRVAYITAVIFLRENGHPLPAEQSMAFGQRLIGALEHSETSASIGAWLRTALGDSTDVPQTAG